MATETRKLLEKGLRNAHALETQAETILKDQYNRLEAYPELRERIAMHADETRNQITRVERCLEKLGTSASMLKDTALQLQGSMQGMMHASASDEVLKDTFASYAFENYEIAAYKALIIMAEDEGEDDIADACRETLEEEERMADWLDEHIPMTVHSYIGKIETGREGQAIA